MVSDSYRNNGDDKYARSNKNNHFLHKDINFGNNAKINTEFFGFNLQVVNLLLLLAVVVSAFLLVTTRFNSRLAYSELSKLRSANGELNATYSRLELEQGAYSSKLVLQGYAQNALKLVEPDNKHIFKVEGEQNVSQ